MPPECQMTLEARREDNDTDTALLVKLQDLKIGDESMKCRSFCKPCDCDVGFHKRDYHYYIICWGEKVSTQ